MTARTTVDSVFTVSQRSGDWRGLAPTSLTFSYTLPAPTLLLLDEEEEEDKDGGWRLGGWRVVMVDSFLFCPGLEHHTTLHQWCSI